MVCTFALRLVRDFLQIWSQTQAIHSHYDPAKGAPVVFRVVEGTYTAQLILAKVPKIHDIDLSSDSDDDEVPSINPSTISCSKSSEHQPGLSKQDPRNRFIYHSDESRSRPVPLQVRIPVQLLLIHLILISSMFPNQVVLNLPVLNLPVLNLPVLNLPVLSLPVLSLPVLSLPVLSLLVLHQLILD